jgi:hypothetical protein
VNDFAQNKNNKKKKAHGVDREKRYNPREI